MEVTTDKSIVPLATSQWITFDIEIKDCYLRQFVVPQYGFADLIVEMRETIYIPVANFTQTPECEFDVSYSVTLLETKYQDPDHPEFSFDRDVGATQDFTTFVTYENGKISI